jgi:hypothetical protein
MKIVANKLYHAGHLDSLLHLTFYHDIDLYITFIVIKKLRHNFRTIAISFVIFTPT